MTPEELAERIRAVLPDAALELSGADCNFEVLVVSELLTGQSVLTRQRMLLGLFARELASGALHALSIRAKTPAELTLVGESLCQVTKSSLASEPER